MLSRTLNGSTGQRSLPAWQTDGPARKGAIRNLRAAIHVYGPQVFINGLTGLLVAQRTFYKSGRALRGEMLRHNSGNFYAEMRRHYSELPPQVISQLRWRRRPASEPSPAITQIFLIACAPPTRR
ncbi:MAG TPA: hypothetical protein VFW76_12230 [Ktedonobacterales bacterium]|nr:hypothetical protein [Ktedonobacterales bacterium]